MQRRSQASLKFQIVSDFNCQSPPSAQFQTSVAKGQSLPASPHSKSDQHGTPVLAMTGDKRLSLSVI